MPYPVAAVRNKNFGSSGLIFQDGFESGDTSKWSSATTGGGDLSVTAGAALVGSYGLQAVINDATNIYVRDNTPVAERRYRYRFYFDPNGLTMATNDQFYIVIAYTGANKLGSFAVLQYDGATYNIRAGGYNDADSSQFTSYIAITDAPHYVEVDFQTSSAAGANDGFIRLWVDGVAATTQKNSVDNDTHTIEYITLGPCSGIDAGTSGTCFFDAFVSNRDGATIGA